MYPCRVPSGPPETDPLVTLAEEASAYRAYLLVIALRILRNASDAEEVVDATLVRLVLERFRTYDKNEQKLKAYLKTCVVRDCYKFLHRVRGLVPLDGVAPGLVATAGGYGDTVQELKMADLQRRVLVCLGSMKDRDRLILRLHYLEDIPVVQIARMCGIEESARPR